MKTVRQLIRGKAIQAVYSVPPQTDVASAMKTLTERNIGALVVVDEGRVVGVVSERDFVRRVVAAGRPVEGTRVREVMTSPAICVRPEQTNEECMELMTDGRVRHLPVVEDGRLLGVVSIGDLVKDLISDQQYVIEQLGNYITGRPS